jgi:hypothetical protein
MSQDGPTKGIVSNEEVRNDVDVNKHQTLSNTTLRHKLKLMNSAFIVYSYNILVFHVL